MPTNDNRIIVKIFHEPEESEDEKIKNAILNHLKKMCEIASDEILKTLGRPEAFVEVPHPCCGRAERLWRYAYNDSCDDRRTIRHELRFYLTNAGVVSRWEWESTSKVN